MSALKFEPLDDYVVLEEINEERTLDGSRIVLPPSHDKQQQPLGRGRVVAVGPGAPLPLMDSRRAMTVKVGDVVLYQRYQASVFGAGIRQTFLLVREAGGIATVVREGGAEVASVSYAAAFASASVGCSGQGPGDAP